MLNLKDTDNQTLVAQLVTLAKAERQNQVEILHCLAEIDERQIVVDLGYSGMWDFCRRALGLSESTSTRRISVARAARLYPELLTMLDDGRLTLCTAADLVPMLTGENQTALFAAAADKSRREVQALGVAPSAKPIERDVIRRVPAPQRSVETPLALAEDKAAPVTGTTRAAAKSEGPVLHRVAFTAEDHVVAKLERLQEILGGATLAEVCDKAADLMLDKVDAVRRAKRREGKAQAKTPVVPRPRREPRKPSAALADQVFAEAGMQCSFASKEGVRCTETRYLTIDHIRPYALGGRSTDKENLRCLCMAHNLLQARKTFGKPYVHFERNDEKICTARAD